MTKEIIIDGINVAGCEHHLSTGYCQLQMIFQGMVLKLPFGKHLECNLCDKDCYYKQLKRLQAENEELKEYKTSKENSYQLLQKQWKDLFVQNRELKEEKQQAIKDWEEKKNLAYELACKNERLKKALEEIRGICKCSKEMNCEECPQCDDCEELCVSDENLQNIITDKINEVLQTEESEG